MQDAGGGDACCVLRCQGGHDGVAQCEDVARVQKRLHALEHGVVRRQQGCVTRRPAGGHSGRRVCSGRLDLQRYINAVVAGRQRDGLPSCHSNPCTAQQVQAGRVGLVDVVAAHVQPEPPCQRVAVAVHGAWHRDAGGCSLGGVVAVDAPQGDWGGEGVPRGGEGRGEPCQAAGCEVVRGLPTG